MSAKALAALGFAPTAAHKAAAGHPAPEGLPAENQFRAGLWRGYRLEAISAGLDADQAIEYANALVLESDLGAGAAEMAPAGPRWFYQGRAGVVRRTIASGLMPHTRRNGSGESGRIPVRNGSKLARTFRWWNAGRKS